MQQTTLIYRPGHAIGLGHLIYSWIGYGTLAQQLGARFLSTLAQSVFDQGQEGQEEQDFLDRTFVSPAPYQGFLQLGYGQVAARLSPEALADKKVLVLGRHDQAQRPAREFPALAGADFADHEADPMPPEHLRRYDLIYVDSVAPKTAALQAQIGPFLPLLQFNAHYRRQAIAHAGSETYLALHLRHGNGENLHGRPRGEEAVFDAFVARLAQETQSILSQTPAPVLCFSDNAATAERMATLTGGRIGDSSQLPDRPFQAFLRSADGPQAPRMEKIFFDLACLAHARHILAAESLFVRAAQQLQPQVHLTIVPPPQADYTA